jgi:hypothetical protein
MVTKVGCRFPTQSLQRAETHVGCSDGDDSSSKKFKRCYGGACGEVWLPW